MRRKMFIVLAICFIVIVTVSLFTWNLSKPHQIKPENSLMINRNFNTLEEEHALTAAEKISYTAIYAAIGSLERFEGSSDPEAYINPEAYYVYTYANFIDSEVINYYQTRYDHQQEQIEPKSTSLVYTANATHLTQVRIFNEPGGTMTREVTTKNSDEKWTQQNITVPYHKNNIDIYVPDNSTPLTTINGFECIFYKNQSKYYRLQPEFDMNFSNCYLVEMNLTYGEYYAPLASFISNVHQIVILDQNLVPVWIGIDRGHFIS